MLIILQTLIYIRDSLLRAIDLVLRPVFFGTVFPAIKATESDEDETAEQVSADFDEEKGVVFYPPVYAQRYAAVIDCLMDERWHGKLEKVVDLGYHDVSFIKYLKEVPGVRTILAVDVETLPLSCSSDLLKYDSHSVRKEDPLDIILLQGNAADPDYRLVGCDAVVAIEMIEHMLPHDLERLLHTVFGFIKPQIAIFTTPNADFNVLFKALECNGLRRLDHYFEWKREQFNDWCTNIIERYPQYTVTAKGVGPGPTGTEHLGCCSQLALFINTDYHKQPDLTIDKMALVTGVPQAYEHFVNDNDLDTFIDDELASYELNCTTLQVRRFSKKTWNMLTKNKLDALMYTRETVAKMRQLRKMLHIDDKEFLDMEIQIPLWNNINWGANAPYWNQFYKIVREYNYPIEAKSEEERILDVVTEEISKHVDKQDQMFGIDCQTEIPIEQIMWAVEHITQDVDKIKELLDWNGYQIVDNVVIHKRSMLDNSHVGHDGDYSQDALTDVKPNKIFIL